MIHPESEASILKVPQTASVGEGCEDWNADKMGKSIPIFEDGILIKISYHTWKPRDWSRVLSVAKRKHFLIHSKRKGKRDVVFIFYITSHVHQSGAA